MFLGEGRCTLVGLDDGNQSFFDFGDIHLQELVGAEGQFLALVDVLDQLVGGQRNYLVHIESQVGRLHLVFDLHEVALQGLLHFLYVRRHVRHVLDFLPLHLPHLRQRTLHLLVDARNHALDGPAD